MRPRFTTFQKIMTAIFIALQIAVMICDVVRLATADENTTGTYYYAVNLVLCIGLLAVFVVLIFNPKICVSSDDTDSEEQLSVLISASRTYMCFIAVDIALIFAFVMFLSKRVSHPALIIVIGGVAMFIAGAVKYIYDSQKLVSEADNNSEAEKEDEDVTFGEERSEADGSENPDEEKHEETSEEISAEENAAADASEAEAPDEEEPDEATAEQAPDEAAAAEGETAGAVGSEEKKTEEKEPEAEALSAE